MKTEFLVNVSFDASHEHPECGPHRHGHLFRVKAWGPKDVEEGLRDIIDELDLRDLGRMMNGGSQSGHGIASWILERLLVVNPEVDGVSVAFRDREFTVIRERR